MPCILDTDNASLIAPITDEEIYDAIFQMDGGKTPGSDGFGPIFFQIYWYIIGPIVIRVVREFFQSD